VNAENEKLEKLKNMSRINARATIFRKTFFSSVYLVIDDIKKLTEGKVTN